jgi:Starch-binding associating with outer membrane
MKKNILIAVASLMAITSCSDGTMDYLNKDTHHPAIDVVPAKYSITDAIVSTAFTTQSGNYAWYVSSLTEQEFGTGNNQLRNAELRKKTELAASSTYDNEWNGTYSNIAALKDIISKTSEGGLNEGQSDILGMAQTLYALCIGNLTDLHGDIPASQAGLGTSVLNPDLDKQEDIYNNEILGSLNSAIDNFKAAISDGMSNAGSQDLLFANDNSQWLGFAYALKARYLLHTYYRNKNVLNDVVTAANNAIEAGFGGAELAIFNGVDCDNPWSAFWWSREYTGSSKTVVDLMNARDDNRVAIYNFDYFENDTYGTPGNESQAGATEYLNIPSWLDNGANTIHMLSKSELYFILAEAKARLGQDATADFQTAVVASFDDYEVSDAYPRYTGFENNGAEYAASLSATLDEIMVQKYLSQCRDEQIEAYNDIRRCKALGEEHIKLTNPLNTQGGSNYWPERLPYGNSSVISNPKMNEAFNNVDIYKDKIWLFGGDK